MFSTQPIRAIVCAFLVSSLALAGCNALETIDRKSDELLDDINAPAHPASSSSSSSAQPSKSQGSGLSVVQREAMPRRTVKDIHGNTVVIWGQSQSTSKTPGHDATIEAQAYSMARSGDYEYITMQRCWRTATGRLGTCRSIPDIIGVRHDGRVDAFEIQSKTDTREELEKRLEEGMESLPKERRGRYRVLPADPTMKGGLFQDE